MIVESRVDSENKDTRHQLQEEVRRFARTEVPPFVPRLDQEEFVFELVELYRQLGFYGIMVPPEYGGQGGDLTDLCIVTEELAYVDAVAAIYLVTPMSAGVLFLLTAGTQEQKERFLPSLAAGRLAAMALTESGAGSDAGAVQATARMDGEAYVIDGEKIFVSLGNVADYVVVFARTGPGPGNRGLSAFIVGKDAPGMTVGTVERKMGFHAKPTVTLHFEGVRVDPRDRLAEEGEGFRVAMRMFNHSRVLQGALAVGLAQGALDRGVAFTRERIQFGKPVAAQQGLRFMMAEMQTNIEAARGLTYRAAAAVSDGKSDMRSLAAMAKYFSSDVAMSVTTDAVQLMGGMGYMVHSGLEKKMRDAKLLQIYEGTNQVLREVVARHVIGKLSQEN